MKFKRQTDFKEGCLVALGGTYSRGAWVHPWEDDKRTPENKRRDRTSLGRHGVLFPDALPPVFHINDNGELELPKPFFLEKGSVGVFLQELEPLDEWA